MNYILMEQIGWCLSGIIVLGIFLMNWYLCEKVEKLQKENEELRNKK